MHKSREAIDKQQEAEMMGNNTFIPMTRRYPALRGKVLRRDARIVSRIISAWDIEHDSEKVLGIFMKEMHILSDERYWELLRTVWVVCGSMRRIYIFRELFNSKRSKRYYFSTPEEHALLRELPDVITVYRATNIPKDGGFSWTLSKQYANQYAKMFDKSAIIERQVRKDEVFAYINRNCEEEILIID